jgi:deoxycytidylate deaminase
VSHDARLCDAAARSTCQKRVIVCALYDRDGELLSVGWNSCAPPNGQCVRLGVRQPEAVYTGTECNSIHGEVQAWHNLPPGAKPYRCVAWGHEFSCAPCQKFLRARGVEVIEVLPTGYGSGLRA